MHAIFRGPFLPVLCALLLVPLAAAAQTTGTIEGEVTAPGGEALPGVTVEITSPSLQGTRTAVTTADGRFRVPSLPPGEYTVTATLAGFASVKKKAVVTLDATATVLVSYPLSTTAEVTVGGQAPILDRTSTTAGTSYHATVVDKLPVGRNYADVVFLQPGVQADWGETQGRSLAISVYGSTSAENLWLVDGVNTTNVIKGFQGKDINNEFVQEVEVKTGGYQAEYGRNTGGVVNVITKSGGNEFHGGVFGYYNDTGMRAYPVNGEPVSYTTPDYSETGAVTIGDNSILSKDVRQEWGMDLGGYFWKDRVWFFGAYDRVQVNQKVETLDPTNGVTFGEEFPRSYVQNKYSGKLTLNVAQGTSVVGSVFSDAETQLGALVTPTSLDPLSYAGRQDVGGPDYGARLNQLFGSFGIFTFQYARHEDRYHRIPDGYDRQRVVDFTISPTGTSGTTALLPGSPGYPSGYGQVYGPTQNNEGRREAFAGVFTAYVGNHELKAGGDYQNDETAGASYWSGGGRVRVRPCLNSTQEPGGTSYCDLEKAPFWMNVNGDRRQVFFEHNFYVNGTREDYQPATAAPFSGSSRRYSAFVQDQWRILPTLTANLGVRWDSEYYYGYDPVAGSFGAFSLTNQWAPRIGVVWDFIGDGTSKLYASAGRFYYALPMDLTAQVFTATSDSTTFNYAFDSLDQDPAAPRRQSFTQGSYELIDPGTKASYQDELTIGVEKALDPTLSVGLKGTYRSLGRTIEDRCDLNYPTAPECPDCAPVQCSLFNPGGSGPAAAGYYPTCNFSGNPTDPTAGDCTTEAGSGVPDGPARRYFRGIELTARKQFSTQIWAQLSFLYSSLIGNYSGAVVEATGQTDPGFNADYDFYQFQRNAYGRLELDRPVQARIDAVYSAPFGLSAGLAFYVRSGVPTSRLGWFLDPNYWDNLYLDTRGTNGRTPTEYDMNLSLGYDFSIGAVTITPTLYLFNVFNNQTVTFLATFFNPNASFVLNPASPYYGQAGVEPGTERPDGTICESPAPCTDFPSYRKAGAWTNPRLLRVALKVTF